MDVDDGPMDDGPANFDKVPLQSEEGLAEMRDNYGDDLVAQPKTTNRIQINYAKTAKRVDVKKLKDNIWTSLTQSPQNASGAPSNVGSRPNSATFFSADLRRPFL